MTFKRWCDLSALHRVPTPQGKQGKCWKIIPDRDDTGNFKIFEKHRQNTGNLKNFKIKSWNKKSMRRNTCCVLSMVLFSVFEMLRNYTGKTEITQEKQNKFCFPRWVGTTSTILSWFCFYALRYHCLKLLLLFLYFRHRKHPVCVCRCQGYHTTVESEGV